MNKYITLWVGIFHELNKLFEITSDREIVHVCLGICWTNIHVAPAAINSKWFHDNNATTTCHYMYTHPNNLLGIGIHFTIRNGNKMHTIVFLNKFIISLKCFRKKPS